MTEPTPDPPNGTDEAPPEPSDRESGAGFDSELDLDDVERTLDGVATALQRLDDRTYWTDERTGDPLPDEVLDADPIARRVP